MDYTLISPGDRVIDGLDGGRVRTVSHVQPYDEHEATVFMTDGGCMGSDEIDHVYLESEHISVADKMHAIMRAEGQE